MYINRVQIGELEQPEVLGWRALVEPFFREPYVLAAFHQEETVGKPSIRGMDLCLPIIKQLVTGQRLHICHLHVIPRLALVSVQHLDREQLPSSRPKA
ncbi:hypothetical protein D3C85_1533150 [compost metagenome]